MKSLTVLGKYDYCFNKILLLKNCHASLCIYVKTESVYNQFFSNYCLIFLLLLGHTVYSWIIYLLLENKWYYNTSLMNIIHEYLLLKRRSRIEFSIFVMQIIRVTFFLRNLILNKRHILKTTKLKTINVIGCCLLKRKLAMFKKIIVFFFFV